jgi:CheY-like chemotaxis protein
MRWPAKVKWMANRGEQGKSILVVDDEPRIAEAVSMNLELEGS